MIVLLAPIVTVIYIIYSFYTDSYGWMLAGGIIILLFIARFIDQGSKARAGTLQMSQLGPIHGTGFYLAYHSIGTLIGFALFADLLYVTYKLLFS